ncbi:MAG: 2-C-methyl-D-erythritol 2,4-cyclodiphosphate synthase [Gammaproteobacteria bacterium]|nr:2-C-methyl-D-erythritol 2,4-cyclodiphosphate synthase [Gammaproteobacteria bacterium]
MRIGMGYDVHAFKDSGRLVLGGVEIDYEKGMEAHSDGDVVLHALCDALLGAAALGDIGKHFPDTDDHFQGIDSRILLRHVVHLLDEFSYKVCNVDITIIAQKPKLADYIQSMCECIAGDLKVAVSQVNVKATTTEKLGFEGRGEGIAVQAVALIQPE